MTQDLVAALRGEAGRTPYDKRLTDLIGELSTRSERFRALWAATAEAPATPAPSHPLADR